MEEGKYNIEVVSQSTDQVSNEGSQEGLKNPSVGTPKDVTYRLLNKISPAKIMDDIQEKGFIEGALGEITLYNIVYIVDGMWWIEGCLPHIVEKDGGLSWATGGEFSTEEIFGFDRHWIPMIRAIGFMQCFMIGTGWIIAGVFAKRFEKMCLSTAACVMYVSFCFLHYFHPWMGDIPNWYAPCPILIAFGAAHLAAAALDKGGFDVFDLDKKNKYEKPKLTLKEAGPVSLIGGAIFSLWLTFNIGCFLLLEDSGMRLYFPNMKSQGSYEQREEDFLVHLFAWMLLVMCGGLTMAVFTMFFRSPLQCASWAVNSTICVASGIVYTMYFSDPNWTP
jgi:hypothetical protein